MRSSMNSNSGQLHAQKKKLFLIIVDGKTSNFRQEIRYSHYRNDPVEYDLNVDYVILMILFIRSDISHLYTIR